MQQVSVDLRISFLCRDASQRRRSLRRVMTLRLSPRMSQLRRPQLTLLHQRLPQLNLNLISLELPRLLSHKRSTSLSSLPSLLETSRLFRLLRITSHQFKRTQLREDMPLFYSRLLLSRRLSTPSTRISPTSRVSMMLPTHSSPLLKTLVSAREKWLNSTLLSRALELSTHLP